MAFELIITERELKRLLELQDNERDVDQMILKISSSNEMILSNQWGINQWAINNVEEWRKQAEARRSDLAWTAFQAGYKTAFSSEYVTHHVTTEDAQYNLRSKFEEWSEADE